MTLISVNGKGLGYGRLSSVGCLLPRSAVVPLDLKTKGLTKRLKFLPQKIRVSSVGCVLTFNPMPSAFQLYLSFVLTFIKFALDDKCYLRKNRRQPKESLDFGWS